MPLGFDGGDDENEDDGDDGGYVMMMMFTMMVVVMMMFMMMINSIKFSCLVFISDKCKTANPQARQTLLL